MFIPSPTGVVGLANQAKPAARGTYINKYHAANNHNPPQYKAREVKCSSLRTTSDITTSLPQSAADDGHARVVIMGASAAGVVKHTLRCGKRVVMSAWWSKSRRNDAALTCTQRRVRSNKLKYLMQSGVGAPGSIREDILLSSILWCGLRRAALLPLCDVLFITLTPFGCWLQACNH